MISTEPGEACLASTCHGISRGLIGLYLGDHKGAVTLAGNHALDQFLGTASAVIPRCVNQPHPERKARAQRFFFASCRMSCLPNMPRALPDRRDTAAVTKLDGPLYARCGDGSRCIESQRPHQRTKRDATFIEFTPAQQFCIATRHGIVPTIASIRR